MINLIKTHWLALTAMVLAGITIGSLWPAAHLPELPGNDKTHHIAGYALLMLPTALRKPRHWFVIAITFIGYSGLIELIQPFVNRYGEWLDLAANSIGVISAIILAALIARFSKPGTHSAAR